MFLTDYYFLNPLAVSLGLRRMIIHVSMLANCIDSLNWDVNSKSKRHTILLNVVVCRKLKTVKGTQKKHKNRYTTNERNIVRVKD